MTTNILAPFTSVEESFQFYVNGRVFEMNETEIKLIENNNEVDSTLTSAVKAFESFEFGNETIKWFHGASKFTYTLTESKFLHNNSEIIGSTFANHVLAAGLIKYNESTKAELFQSIPSILENFVTLDFAASFEGNNISVDAFKLNEQVYIARFNKTNNIGKFFVATANEALNYIQEQTGENASQFLSELLEGEEASNAKIEETVIQYESMIAFLKDQRGLLAEADKTIEEIKAADILINSEIKIWENKIEEIKA